MHIEMPLRKNLSLANCSFASQAAGKSHSALWSASFMFGSLLYENTCQAPEITAIISILQHYHHLSKYSVCVNILPQNPSHTENYDVLGPIITCLCHPCRPSIFRSYLNSSYLNIPYMRNTQNSFKKILERFWPFRNIPWKYECRTLEMNTFRNVYSKDGAEYIYNDYFKTTFLCHGQRHKICQESLDANYSARDEWWNKWGSVMEGVNFVPSSQ